MLAGTVAPLRAQTAEPFTHQKLVPTLWVQTSVEWRAACLETYRAATQALDKALKNRSWSAAIEQRQPFSKLRPAVILDIDETVLDNSPGQARQVLNRTDFVAQDWNRWVTGQKAMAIPGAQEFCRYAKQRKVEVFFVTNRDADQKQATIANLTKLGFPVTPETVLCRGEKPEWTSEKSTRRDKLVQSYRILLLLGDDLGDFLPNARTTIEDRRAKAAAYDANWGTKWFMLPNPGYGSWEGAVLAPNPPTDPAARVELKLRKIDPRQN